LKANKEAIKAVRPGVSCKALHDLAHKIIADAGFGDAFQHSLGHGVGYEIHELPKVSRRSKDVLKEGMIFTIEPGIYLEGKLGVRIEDLVLVTQTGCEVLSRTAK
jgi:Xaa-Pro aminopeptidase